MYNLLEKSCLYIIDTLYHQSVFCIILFILIFVLSRFFRGKSPHWLLGLWFLILLRLVLPTDLSLSFSARNLAGDFLSAHNVNASIEEVSDRLSVKYKPDQIFELNLPKLAEREKSIVTPVLSDSGDIKNISFSWPVKLSIFWLLGVLTFLTMFLSKIQSIRRVLDHSSLVRDKNTIAIVDYWRHIFHISRRVKIYSSDKFLSPFTTGLLRPKIFIPESLLRGMDNETINSIIAHEMVHIKNFDHAWIRFQNVLQILYFFHPVVWYANSQINIERDRLCDSEVLAKHVIPPKAFGKSVIDVLKFNLSGYRVIEPLLCFSNHKNIYEYRIRDILKGKTISKTKSCSIFLLICLLGLFLLPMSNANINSKRPEISELKTVTAGAAKEPGTIFGEVPDDATISPPEMKIGEEEDAAKKQVAEAKIIEGVTEKRISNGALSTISRDEKTVSGKQARQLEKIEVGFQIAPTETIERSEVPLHSVSDEEKENLPENGNPKNGKTVSDQYIKSNEPLKQSQSSGIDYFSRGMTYLKNGDVEDAISDLNRAIKQNPENAVAYFSRGKANFKNGQVQSAISDYDKAIEINPGYLDVYFSRGYYYQTIGEYEKAISDYNKVISIRPGNARAYNYRGSAYFVQEEYRKAFADFNKAIDLNPGFAAAYQNRGSVYYRMDKQHKAISDYMRSIELNPNLAASYQDRGSIYFNQDRFDEAISDYSKALQLEPEDPVTYNNRGVAYFAQKEYQKAFNDFTKVIELNPECADAYIYRGYYHQIMREYSKAVADYNIALKLDPGIDVAKKLLKEAAKKLASIGSQTIDTDSDQEMAGFWVEKGKAKRKEREPEQELQKTKKWISKTTPSFPPHEGVNQTYSLGQLMDMYSR